MREVVHRHWRRASVVVLASVTNVAVLLAFLLGMAGLAALFPTAECEELDGCIRNGRRYTAALLVVYVLACLAWSVTLRGWALLLRVAPYGSVFGGAVMLGSATMLVAVGVIAVGERVMGWFMPLTVLLAPAIAAWWCTENPAPLPRPPGRPWPPPDPTTRVA